MTGFAQDARGHIGHVDRVLITCNRDDLVRLARAQSNSGLIVLIRRRSRIAECANLLRLIESATESGLAGNINFA